MTMMTIQSQVGIAILSLGRCGSYAHTQANITCGSGTAACHIAPPSHDGRGRRMSRRQPRIPGTLGCRPIAVVYDGEPVRAVVEAVRLHGLHVQPARP